MVASSWWMQVANGTNTIEYRVDHLHSTLEANLEKRRSALNDEVGRFSLSGGLPPADFHVLGRTR